LEINPWATDPHNKLFCIDGKLNVDDNAKFRQEKLLKMKAESLGSEEIDVHE
jgi:succinyl-CoA synthetase beta subunit